MFGATLIGRVTPRQAISRSVAIKDPSWCNKTRLSEPHKT